MATKYTDWDNGLDTNGGNSPDASDASATNRPYKTIGKGISVLASGDILYVAPGVYRETVAAATIPTWTSRTRIIGDPLNKQGFKNSAGARKAPGFPRWTAYTTSDTAAPAASPPVDFSGKNFWSLEYLVIQGDPSDRAIRASSSPHDMWLDHCVIMCAGNGYAVDFAHAYLAPVNLTVDNSIFFTCGGVSANHLSFIHASGVSGDWDPAILVRNSTFYGAAYSSIAYLKTGANAGVMGGATVEGCTILSNVGIGTGNSSTTFKWILRNNIIIAATNPVQADSTTQIDSDYNHYIGSANQNVTLGANDHTTDWAPHFDLGVSRLFGLGDRPYHSLLLPTPWQGSGQNLFAADMFGLARPNPNSRGALEAYAGDGPVGRMLRGGHSGLIPMF